jgi:hypothetical protein
MSISSLVSTPVGSPMLVTSSYGMIGQPIGSSWDYTPQPFEWTSDSNCVGAGSSRMDGPEIPAYVV